MQEKHCSQLYFLWFYTQCSVVSVSKKAQGSSTELHCMNKELKCQIREEELILDYLGRVQTALLLSEKLKSSFLEPQCPSEQGMNPAAWGRIWPLLVNCRLASWQGHLRGMCLTSYFRAASLNELPRLFSEVSPKLFRALKWVGWIVLCICLFPSTWSQGNPKRWKKTLMTSLKTAHPWSHDEEKLGQVGWGLW